LGFIILISTTVGYVLFEVAICLIQAYIFCLLLSLYSDDHAH
jgi:F0F1-type ATP synthase membrane subunit a